MSQVNQSAPVTLPLLYSSVDALDRDKHRMLRLASVDEPYAFAREASMLPAVLAEFRSASLDLPILFMDNGSEISPFFLVGLTAGNNVFVDAKGDWTARHVPAYLRRYPFVGADAEGDQQIICFDPASKALQHNEGEALFGDDGAVTPALERVIGFVNEYVKAARETQAFCRSVASLELFKKIDVDIRTPKGHSASFHGLLVIDEAKLNTLGKSDFNALRAEGFLSGIYAHLASLANIAGVGERHDKTELQKAA
jgi:hypothetical protein